MAKKPSRRGRILDVDVRFPPELFARVLTWLTGSESEAFATAAAFGTRAYKSAIDPRAFACADSFRPAYLESVVLSKMDSGDSSNAALRAQLALAKFSEMETHCANTNSFLYRSPAVYFEKGISSSAVIFTARRKIERLLGEFSWSKCEVGFDFGPGASTRVPRSKASLVNKFSGKPEVTSNCADLARAFFNAHLPWKVEALGNQDVPEDPFVLVKGNRIVTVPKNAEIDRVIAIEPDLNMFFQKGIGSFLRSRLKKVGVDLDDQTKNQDLAREGSISGDYATVDLSSASDTVSRGVVELLLPPDWLFALEQCRSPKGVLPCGTEILYRKFSSMGNGYTFELESLIFWAICASVDHLMGLRDIRRCVYGDDLVIHSTSAGAIERALLYFGFIPNPSKSYFDGPFRESCGKHYFRGADVTPFYVRKPLRRLSDVFLFHNNVLRWCKRGDNTLRLPSGASDQDRVAAESGHVPLVASIRDTVPVNWRRPRIPDGYGDGAFIGTFDEVRPSPAPYSLEGFQCKVLTELEVDTVRDDYGNTRAPLLASLWACGKCESGMPGSSVQRSGHGGPPDESGRRSRSVQRLVYLRALRDSSFRSPIGTRSVRSAVRLTRTRIVKILVPQWADLGPWY